MKTLVVWYSRKGYVREAALEKVKEENADFLELDSIDDDQGYDGFGNCVKSAIKKSAVVLFPYDTDVSSYDKVIICTPVWCGTVASPVRQFITAEKHNIKRAEYVIFHCMPTVCSAVADEMDKILRLKREKCTDIQCIFGKRIKEQDI
ncbi:MAG: flavodoxin domain-containing protein [Clostridiales bacterium]|nr:flavodoxin domain-containing protein [Clostridiales bacterium]